MASKRLPPVRPVSRDQSHARIRNLKCYPEMYSRILDGWPLPEVAKFIQEVKKESLDVTQGGLVAALTDFRKTIPPAQLTQKRMPKAFMDAAEEVSEGLDELKEMEKLYKLQMARVQIDFAHEKGIKKLMPTMGQEVRIAREVLASYADLKMSLGLSKRHLGKMEVDARVLTDVAVRYETAAPDVKQVMENPQSRQKILGLVEKLLTKSTAKVVGDLSETTVASPDIIDVEPEVPAREIEESLGEDLFPEFGDDAPEVKEEASE